MSPPRSGWLAGLGHLKDGDYWLTPPRLTFSLLFPDVSLHGFQFVTHGGHRVAPHLEMLAREVLQLPPKLPGNRHGPLALQEADDRGHRMLGQDLNTPVNMICQQMAFPDPTLLLPPQLVRISPYTALRRYFGMNPP